VHSIPDSYVDISMEAAYRQKAVAGGSGFPSRSWPMTA
jgi:hypothetical protein